MYEFTVDVDTLITNIQHTSTTLVLASNTGISPFLTLFLIGLIQKLSNNNVFNFNEDGGAHDLLEDFLASWPALCSWGVMTIFELISKNIPVVDEMVDSVMVYIVPIMSALATLSSFGIYIKDEQQEENRRFLENDDEDESWWLHSFPILLLQIFVICVGIALALAIHLFKMFIRLAGEGWLTNIIAVFETCICISTVLFAIFVKQLAVLLAICFCIAGVRQGRKWWLSRKEEQKKKKRAEEDEEDEEDYNKNTNHDRDLEKAMISPTTTKESPEKDKPVIMKSVTSFTSSSPIRSNGTTKAGGGQLQMKVGLRDPKPVKVGRQKQQSMTSFTSSPSCNSDYHAMGPSGA